MDHFETSRAGRTWRSRWIRMTVMAVTVGALMLGSIASVAARPGGHTLRVMGHATSYTTTQADPDGSVFAPGDEVFLGATLLRLASPHNEIGTAGLHCSATGVGGSELLCDVVFTLPAGKISGQTLFDLQTEWLASTRKLAITGGTGDYRHARGEIIVTTLSSGDETITFVFD